MSKWSSSNTYQGHRSSEEKIFRLVKPCCSHPLLSSPVSPIRNVASPVPPTLTVSATSPSPTATTTAAPSKTASAIAAVPLAVIGRLSMPMLAAHSVIPTTILGIAIGVVVATTTGRSAPAVSRRRLLKTATTTVVGLPTASGG